MKAIKIQVFLWIAVHDIRRAVVACSRDGIDRDALALRIVVHVVPLEGQSGQPNVSTKKRKVPHQTFQLVVENLHATQRVFLPLRREVGDTCVVLLRERLHYG